MGALTGFYNTGLFDGKARGGPSEGPLMLTQWSKTGSVGVWGALSLSEIGRKVAGPIVFVYISK